MRARMKKSSEMTEIFKMFGFSILAAIVAAAILLVLSAVLLEKLSMDEKQANLLIYIVYIISSIIAGFIAGKWKKEKKFIWGILAGFSWFLVILGISIVRNGFGIDAKELFPAVVCMLGGGMLGGMLA